MSIPFTISSSPELASKVSASYNAGELQPLAPPSVSGAAATAAAQKGVKEAAAAAAAATGITRKKPPPDKDRISPMVKYLKGQVSVCYTTAA